MITSITLPSSTYPSISTITINYFPSYLSSFLKVYCHNYLNYWPLYRSCFSYIKFVLKILLCSELITKIFSTIISSCTFIRVILLSRIEPSQRESSICLLNSHKYSIRYLTFSIFSTTSTVSYVEGFSPISLDIINTVSIINANLY